MAEIKGLLRERLQELSKEELIDIIADISSVYIRAGVLGRMSSANRVQQCVNNVQTETLNEQKINDSLFSQPIVSKYAEAYIDPTGHEKYYRELLRRGHKETIELAAEMFRNIEESKNRLCDKKK